VQRGGHLSCLDRRGRAAGLRGRLNDPRHPAVWGGVRAGTADRLMGLSYDDFSMTSRLGPDRPGVVTGSATLTRPASRSAGLPARCNWAVGLIPRDPEGCLPRPRPLRRAADRSWSGRWTSTATTRAASTPVDEANGAGMIARRTSQTPGWSDPLPESRNIMGLRQRRPMPSAARLSQLCGRTVGKPPYRVMLRLPPRQGRP
jgi:hypothetical protein